MIQGTKVKVISGMGFHDFVIGAIVECTGERSTTNTGRWKFQSTAGHTQWMNPTDYMVLGASLDDLSTLEVGNKLDCGDYNRTILSICGRVLLLSEGDDPETFDTGYTVEEIRAEGWKLKGASTATQMTVADVEAKLGHRVEIIADK